MRKLTEKLVWLASGGALLFLAACATIMHGTQQNIGISSTPSDAFVDINGQSYGKTPLMVKLARKDNHLIKIELSGYLPFEMHIMRKISGWVWGNVAFGGLIGLAVDAISGGLYKLTPEQVSATLVKSQGTFYNYANTVYIITALKPDPSWEQVGALVPANIQDNKH